MRTFAHHHYLSEINRIWKRSLEWVESLDLDHSIGATEDTGSNTDENLEDDSDNYDEKKKNYKNSMADIFVEFNYEIILLTLLNWTDL